MRSSHRGSYVSASPAGGGVSLFGIRFDDARIARVRITTGNVALRPNANRRYDVVAMNDFMYGEPRAR
jgi:hypothetical protein